MEKEFNLSEKIHTNGYAIDVRFVKIFIKRLKEEYPCVMKKRKCQKHWKNMLVCSNCKMRWKINKLCGEKLKWKKN